MAKSALPYGEHVRDDPVNCKKREESLVRSMVNRTNVLMLYLYIGDSTGRLYFLCSLVYLRTKQPTEKEYERQTFCECTLMA